MVGEEKRHQMMQNLFGDQSEEEEEEEEVESEHESNRQPDYTSDEVDGRPESDSETEGQGEAEVGSEGERHNHDSTHGESEGERYQSSQEVEIGDLREESVDKYSDSDEREQYGQRGVTNKRHGTIESGSERSGENHYAPNEDEVNLAQSPRSPDDEKNDDKFLHNAPEIRDVFGDSDDEEQADFERSPMDEKNFERGPEDMVPDEDAPYDSEEEHADSKLKEKPVGPPLELEIPLCYPPAASDKMNLIKVSNIMGIDSKPFDPNTYVEEDFYETDESGSKKRIRLENNVVRWRKVKKRDGTISVIGTPSKLSPRKKLSDWSLDRPIWNPRDIEQLRVVKEALHLSTAPQSVVCREDEQNKILDFCKSCVEQDKAGSLYICGCPGTGKSLSVEKIKDILINWANQKELQPPDMLSINCTSLVQTTEIFSKILGNDNVLKKPNCPTSPLQLLCNLYSQKQPREMRMRLVIADELDYLITKDHAVLHDLFMLTTMPFSRCILLGIANAIDLADRFMPKLQSLNCKPMVITFRAYSKDQIISILEDRLKVMPYTIFQPQAIELCAGKVSAASGDMRKALSIFRSAIEILEAEIKDSVENLSLSPDEKIAAQQKLPTSNMLTNRINNMVRIDHVSAALSKAFKSPIIDTIQSLPQHQQIILCSAVKLFRGGKKATTIGELNKSYRDVCNSTSIPPVGIMELSSMCKVLDDQGIINLGQSRDDKVRRVALKVDQADIVFALQGVRFFRNCLQ